MVIHHINQERHQCGERTLSAALLSLVTIVTGGILASSHVSAEDNTSIVDEIGIEIPVSCTMSGTSMNSHTATVPNGTSNSSIGQTTIKAFCNDNNGFSIYAVGFTNYEYGNNVLTDSNLDSTHNIPTGTSTSGTNSNWAMKLSTTTTSTYPIIIAGSTSDT